MITASAKGMRLFGKAAIFSALVCALATTFVGCDNVLAAEAVAIQAKTVSPVISVKLADSSALSSGGSLSFGTISVGASSDITLTIRNTGVNALSLDLAGIKVTPDSSTAAGVFSVGSAPSAMIDSSSSSSIVLHFVPDSEGAKGATISIPTNDLSCPSFSISLSGKGWAVALATTAVSSISYTTAGSGGNITNDGGEDIIERGICWSTSPNPTTGDRKQSDAGVGTGSYTCSLSGLLPGTYYYVRAYARTSLTTGYGPTVGFTTAAATSPATATVSAINATSATAGCTAIADAGVTVGECGVCWSTSSGPTTAGSHIAGTSGGSITLSGLNLATTYYLRSYAILYSTSASNTVTVYGAETSFKTVGYKDSDGFYVFYDAGSIQTDATYGNWRYMVAAPSDMGTSKWSNTDGTLLGATATAIGTGISNTAIIVAALGVNSVSALACTTATFTGYPAHADWYLPSKDELDLMMVNLAQNALGGFSSNNALFYWSSSEIDVYKIYIQSLSIGTGNYRLRKDNNTGLTRAARRITVLP
jgi:hypothetical protein